MFTNRATVCKYAPVFSFFLWISSVIEVKAKVIHQTSVRVPNVGALGSFNPSRSKLSEIHPLAVMSLCCDPEFQVRGNYSYLFNLRRNIIFKT